MGRGEGHGINVIKILDFIQDNNINIKIKMNTLVSKVNENEIIDIGKILKKYNIKRWRLFKFIPLRNYAVNGNAVFEISNENFEQIVSKVKSLYQENMNISERNEDKIQSNYLLINSVGDFIITENMKDKKIYNIEEENYEILKKYL